MSHAQALLSSKCTVNTLENPELIKDPSVGAVRQQAEGP